MPSSAKDPQAEVMIASAVSQQPDAAYLLVQRALLMDQALAAAKAQITTLQNQIQATQAAPSRGFLDSANAWGNSPVAAPRPSASMMPSAPAPMQAPLAQAAPAASPGFFGGGMGGTLGTVAATAAGVAGGAFLFQGIEHMMHPNTGAGFLNQPGMAPLAAPVENTTVNNYYGDDKSTDDNSTTDDIASDDSSSDTSGDDDSSLI